MPRISVCITHYNRPGKLGATLASLAAQTRMPDEVFLWDDCSQNDPTSVVREWKDRFPHFVYHRNAINLGMPGNLNSVVSQATGDYIANLHDADIFERSLLEKWSTTLDAYPMAGMVFCRDSRWENDRFVKCWAPEPPPVTDGRKFFHTYYLGRLDSIIWGSVMVRRMVYDQLLPFDSKFVNWADVDMWMRVCGVSDVAYLRDQLIELDHTETPHRIFSFYKFGLVQRMALSNIERLYTGTNRASAIQKQKRVWRRLWLRWMLGGLKHRDWPRLAEGWRSYNV